MPVATSGATIEAKKSRVLILQPSRAPYRIALLKRLSEHYDITVAYVAGAHDPARQWATVDDKSFRSLDPDVIKVKALGKRFSFSLRGALEIRKDYDALVTCTNILELPTYLVASVVARLRGTPTLCLVSINRDYSFIRRPGRVAQLIDRLMRSALSSLIRLSQYTLCYSQSGVLLAKDCGRPGLSSSQYYPLDEEYNRLVSDRAPRTREDNRTLRACTIGYITPRKGVLELLRELNSLESDISLTVAGPVSNEDGLPDKLRKEAASDVRFAGAVNTQEKVDLFNSSDIMFFPTLHDSWGFVVNEAMYFGVPVIATRNSEAAKDLIVDGVNGWVYDDEESFRRAIACARNPETLARVREAAASSVRTFNSNAFAAWCSALDRTLTPRNRQALNG